MITDLFGSLLQEIAALLHIPKVAPDSNNSCLLRFKGDINVQLEIDRTGKYLIIGSNFVTIPEGRYREIVFTEAMKANSQPLPRYGVFAYSKASDQLVLFEMLSLKDLTGAKVADFIPPFVEKVRNWKTAIEKGETPTIYSSYGSSKPTGMLGLK